MISEYIRSFNVSAKDLDIGVDYKTLYSRINSSYRKWTKDELFNIAKEMYKMGKSFDPYEIYRMIYTDAERFEDLLEYLPLTQENICDELNITMRTYHNRLREGFKDIDEINILKGLLLEHTLFPVREYYW